MHECNKAIVERLIMFAVTGGVISLLLFSASILGGAIGTRADTLFLLPLVGLGYIVKGAAIGFAVAVAFPARAGYLARVKTGDQRQTRG